MGYRTKTYIAGDWDSSKQEIEKLKEWNEKKHLALEFLDAHEKTQARDGSLNCSIKKSLKTRLDITKKFILIVGNSTNNTRSGSCQYCDNYSKYIQACLKGYSTNFKSYIDYECSYASTEQLDIIVLYCSVNIQKNLCPDSIKSIGIHIPMYYYSNGKKYWNYEKIKKAICN